MDMEIALQSVRAGSMSFDRFARETRDEWQKIAQWILNRWTVPAWVGVEDVEQDLLFAAWRFLDKYDATRGVALKHFIVWNAMDKAKKALHKSRGASLDGNAGANPSVIERPVDYMLEEGEGPESRMARKFMSVLVDDATPFDAVARTERIERVFGACETSRDRAVVIGLLVADGSSLDAAFSMYRDTRQRRACGFRSEEHARWAVRTSITQTIANANTKTDRIDRRIAL